MKTKLIVRLRFFLPTAIFLFMAPQLEASGVVKMQQVQQQRQQQAYEQAAQQQILQARQQQLQQQAARQQYQQQVQQQQRQFAAQQQQWSDQMQRSSMPQPQAAPRYSNSNNFSYPGSASSNLTSGYQSENMPLVANASTTDVMDIRQVWDELEQSSQIWLQIVDLEPKEITIAEYIDLFRTQGAVIRKSPPHYAALIDQMLLDTPEMAERPFTDLLRLAAILEYDYDVGVDKDALARQFLGDQLYQQNKERLGIP